MYIERCNGKRKHTCKSAQDCHPALLCLVSAATGSEAALMNVHTQHQTADSTTVAKAAKEPDSSTRHKSW